MICYITLTIGCLFNIIMLMNTNFFFSFFLTSFIEYINNLYPAKANVILSISNFNEIYDLEFTTIFICILSKNILIYNIFLLYYIKHILYFHEFFLFFSKMSIYLIIIFLLLKIFLLFFPFFIYSQISHLYQYMIIENIILTFNLNIINEINNVIFYLTFFFLFSSIFIKYIIAFIILMYPPFLLFYFLYSLIKNINNSKKKKEWDLNPR